MALAYALCGCFRGTPDPFPGWQELWRSGVGSAGQAVAYPLLLTDPVRRFHLPLLADFRPANHREELPAAALLLQPDILRRGVFPTLVEGD